jgi:hypothetical protein
MAGPRHSDKLSTRAIVKWKAIHTQDDKNNVCLPVELSKGLSAVIERQIDDSTQDSATVTVREPVREISSSAFWRWVAEHDGTLSSPKQASRYTTSSRTEVDEPLCAMPVILISSLMSSLSLRVMWM